jgi:hypothetical protein
MGWPNSFWRYAQCYRSLDDMLVVLYRTHRDVSGLDALDNHTFDE